MMNALSGPLPIFFKWVALLTVISSITSIFTPWLSWALANIPYYTLIYINLWRPFTSCMVEQSLMMGLFALIIMFFILPEIERNISTTITVVDFFMSNFLVQVFYCLCWIPVFCIWPNIAKQMYSGGIWIMWMVYIVRICQSDPKGRIRLCCLPILIFKRLYPLAIIGAMMAFSWSLQLDMWLVYILTLVQCKCFNGSIFIFRRPVYLYLQKSCILGWMSKRNDYITVEAAPKSKCFCKGEGDHKEFYGNFMGTNLASEQNNPVQQNQLPSIPTVPTFNDMGQGVSLSTGVKSVVTLDDVRAHWASKGPEGTASTQSEKRFIPQPGSQKPVTESLPTSKTQDEGAYATFSEQQS